MAENNQPFSTESIMALARSPAGRQLLALLQQSGGNELQQAAAMAGSGDMDGAKQLLTPLLADPQIRALLAQLGGR